MGSVAVNHSMGGGMAAGLLLPAAHGRFPIEPWLYLTMAGLLVGVVVLLRRVQACRLARQTDHRMRAELEAYARLDCALAPGADGKALARRVCRTVAEKSIFRRCAMLIRNAEGKLYVACSTGMDDLAVAAMHAWGDGLIRQERKLAAMGPAYAPVGELAGSRSFIVLLRSEGIAGEDGVDDGSGDAGSVAGGCRRLAVTLLRSQTGSILGALAVCPDEVAERWRGRLDDAMPAIQILAVKLGQSIEHAQMTERLMRAERLAGLGQLAGGIAHELNNPLTAVLGFAELIAETAGEPRVAQDARTISREALRMKETVQSLLHFWRPVRQRDETVQVSEMLAELAADCAGKLQARGVDLVVDAPSEVPELAGNGERLRHMLEHLLNNAAQAIASSQEGRRVGDTTRTPGLPRGSDDGDRSPWIRVAVTHDTRTLHLVVSDTGPGFAEPSRVFDPFFTTRQPGEGMGLGLSICYGIVREHGGEILAFNLQPHGAAVVVELPLRRTVLEEPEAVLRDHTGLLGIAIEDAPRHRPAGGYSAL